MNSAPAPEATGEPETGVSAPVVLTANEETFPEPELETKAKLMVCPDDIDDIEELRIALLHPTSKRAAETKPRNQGKRRNPEEERMLATI
jgi:hypothetical protein